MARLLLAADVGQGVDIPLGGLLRGRRSRRAGSGAESVTGSGYRRTSLIPWERSMGHGLSRHVSGMSALGHVPRSRSVSLRGSRFLGRLAPSWPPPFLTPAAFLARRARPLRGGTGVAPACSREARPLRSDVLRRVAGARRERGVGLAVGDVGTEAAFLQHDGRPSPGRGRAPSAGAWPTARPRPRLGWAKTPAPGRQVMVEQLAPPTGERPAVRALLQVGPVAPVLGDDLLAVGRIDPDDAGQAEQLRAPAPA